MKNDDENAVLQHQQIWGSIWAGGGRGITPGVDTLILEDDTSGAPGAFLLEDASGYIKLEDGT